MEHRVTARPPPAPAPTENDNNETTTTTLALMTVTGTMTIMTTTGRMTNGGSRDASASRLPGMFFFLFLSLQFYLFQWQ